MGAQAFQLVGTAVGTYFGGPLGGAVGGAIGGAIGNQVFPPDVGPDVHGPRLQDLKATHSEYGTAIPWVFGTDRKSVV